MKTRPFLSLISLPIAVIFVSSVITGCSNRSVHELGKPTNHEAASSPSRNIALRQDLADSLCQFLLLQHADAMSEQITDSSNHARVTCISQTDTSSGDSIISIRLGYSDDFRFSVAHIFEFSISQAVLYHYDPIEDRRVVYTQWVREWQK